MKKKHYVALFIFIIVLGTGLYAFINLGYFPVAIVNGEFITERQYNKNIIAALNYYNAADKTYKLNIDTGADRLTLKKLALDQIIESKIVHQELARRLGDDLGDVIQNKLSDLQDKPDFIKAATTLYGINFGDFTDLFLRPIAEREILDGKLFMEKTTYDDWLVQAKNQASITILINNFSWDGKEVSGN